MLEACTGLSESVWQEVQTWAGCNQQGELDAAIYNTSSLGCWPTGKIITAAIDHIAMAGKSAGARNPSRRRQLVWDYVRDIYLPMRLMSNVRSVAQIRISVRSLEKFLNRPAMLDELSNELICRWLAWRLPKCSKETAKRDRSTLLAIWRDAMGRKKCRRVPIEVPTIRLSKKVPRAVPVPDIEKLLTAAAAYRPKRRQKMPACGCWAKWWVGLLLGIYDCAGRINAMLNVRVGDVDLVGLTITLQCDPSKTDLEQVLPITQQTADAIAKVIGGRSATELVFDFPCRRRAIWLKLKALAASAGVTLVRGQAFHSIRKTNATLTTALISVEAAARTLGHGSTAMTWQRYVDPRLLRSLQSQSVNLLPRPMFVRPNGSRDRQLCLFD